MSAMAGRLGAIVLGLALGAAGAILAGRWGGTATDLAIARERAEIERLLSDLRARTASAADARRAAEARALAAEDVASRVRREAAERIAAVRRPVAAVDRARRVAVAVAAPLVDVVPDARGGRPGFWIAEPVLVELEAARTASVTWGEERRALIETIGAQREQLRAGSLELGLARATIARLMDARAREIARADSPPPCEHGTTFAVVAAAGIAAGVAVGVGLAAALDSDGVTVVR